MKSIFRLSSSYVIHSIMIVALTTCAPGSDTDSTEAMDSSGVISVNPGPIQSGSPDSASSTPSIPIRSDDLARTNFNIHCATCHGSDQTSGRAPTLFNQVLLSERTDETLRMTILKGIQDAGMPSFDGILNDTEMVQLLTFIRNEASKFAEHPVFVPSPENYLVHTNKQSLSIEVVASGLDVPWGLAFLPDGRILVTERSGTIRIIDEELLPEPVLGTPKVQVGQDAGMFDVAVHPEYQENGWIYLSYAETLPGYIPSEEPPADPSAGKSQPPSMTVIVRGKLSSDNRWIETQELYRAPPQFYTASGVHYGSRFVFDHQGHLFFSIGERGNMANAQDLSSPLGKIHRINDNGSLPTDNPFINMEGAVPSIWSYGHRNPQGLAFDPSTGLLWSSEHGPTGGDEINIIEPGNNYGWGVITMGLARGLTQHRAPGMEQPIVHYTPTLAPSGINFYTGDRYPGWHSSLFVAGLAGQQLRRLQVQGRDVLEQEILFDQFGRTRTAVFGPDGLLYVLLQNPTGSGTGLQLSEPTPGMVIRLIPLD